MDRDDTWRTLVETMREVDGVAKGVAASVLQAQVLRTPRHIDWGPVHYGIHAMLDGTSLFETSTLIDVLLKTEVTPADARPFLKGGGELLLDHFASGTPMLSQPAHALLVQLRGEDLGPDVGPWRAWIAAL